MNMKKPSLLLRLLGYCELEVSLLAKERFLNLCMRYGFDYYALKIDDENRRMLVRVAFVGYKRIRTACRVRGIRVKILHKKGFLPELLNYRGRWGLLVGFVLSGALFCVAQSVIWRIDVIGNDRLSETEIIEALSENGLSVGDRISNLNTSSIEHRIMINNDDVAWISIDIVGTVAQVEIREVIDTKIKKEEISPANLVSRYDAQIVSLEVLQGFSIVREGDFVRAGEMIVSGIYQSEKAPIRYTRAAGKVFGRVTREFEVEIPLVQLKKVPTGKKITKKTLIFFGNPINFFINYRNLPTSYDIINYVYALNPFSLGELPISLSVNEYYEYEMIETEISEEEAIDQAYDLLRQRIDEELPEAQILKQSFYGEAVDGKYVLKCTVIAVCNIAKQVEFEVLD